MLSHEHGLKLEAFVKQYCTENNIGMYRADERYYNLVSNIYQIQSDVTVGHIITHYKTLRYAIGKRTVFYSDQLKSNLYTNWIYYDLFTGKPITDIVFLPGVNELEKTDLTKIAFIQSRKIYIDNFLGEDKEIKVDPVKTDDKKTFDLSLLKKKPDPGPFDESDIYDDSEAISQAGFDYKNILWIGLIGAAIYMVLK